MLRRKHEHEWSWKPPISFHGHQMVPNCLVTVHPAGQSKPSHKQLQTQCNDATMQWCAVKSAQGLLEKEQYEQRGNTICHASYSKAFQSSGQKYLKNMYLKSAADVDSGNTVIQSKKVIKITSKLSKILLLKYPKNSDKKVHVLIVQYLKQCVVNNVM